MGKVTDPPDEVFVVGYTWKRGAASGGTTKVFTSLAQAVTHLHDMEVEDTYELSNITVHTLTEATWEPLVYVPPAKAEIRRGDDLSRGTQRDESIGVVPGSPDA